MATFKIKADHKLNHEGKEYLPGDSIELSEEEVKKVGDVLEPADGALATSHAMVADRPADVNASHADETKTAKKEKSGLFGGFGKSDK